MAGMLTGLLAGPDYRDLRAQDLDEENRLQRLAQMNPVQQNAYAGLTGARMAGQGIAQVVGGALGYDTRNPAEKNLDAVRAVKDQVSKLGLDPNDPKSRDNFYRTVISILQKQGLAAEAMDVAREYHSQTLRDQQLDLANRKEQRQQDTDAQKLDILRANQEARAKALEAAGLPPIEKLLRAAEAQPEGSPGRAARMQAAQSMLDSQQKGRYKAVDYNDRVGIMDTTTGQEVGSQAKGAAPMSEKDRQKIATNKAAAQNAYRSMKSGLQRDYDAAVQLYNHPGLQDALGPVAGDVWVRGPSGAWQITNYSRLSAGGQDAGAEIQKVQGSTFIQALQALKSQSRTGASGLGQLTEIEGSKIQSAMAALDPHQPYPAFRQHLAQYIQALADKANEVDEAARESEIAADVPFQPKQLMASPGRYTPPAAKNQVVAPRAEPRTSGASDRVRVRMPDGRTGTIPRAQLDAAKAKGATEIQ